MGGGGGQHDLAPVTQGRLPKFAQQQIVPPKAPPTIPPKLAVDPTLVMQKDLKMANNTMPNLGMPNSTLPGASLGTGSGGGIGSGNGRSGAGQRRQHRRRIDARRQRPGSRPSSSIRWTPSSLRRPARPSSPAMCRSIWWSTSTATPPMSASSAPSAWAWTRRPLEAVRQYKFKPAMNNGKPVPVDLYIDVNFQIF
jgi:protein TonB